MKITAFFYHYTEEEYTRRRDRDKERERERVAAAAAPKDDSKDASVPAVPAVRRRDIDPHDREMEDVAIKVVCRIEVEKEMYALLISE